MQPVEKMACSSIAVKPRDFRWNTKHLTDFGNDIPDGCEWDFWEGVECEECDEIIVFHGSGGDEPHTDLDPDSDCEGYVPRAEGPMMNYWYRVDDDLDEEEAARAIADLPVCVVRVDGDLGLALTGGGMDLSWEICEAYMRLGHLPPFHFCDLPGMSGRGTSERDRWIVSGCKRTCEVLMHWAESTRERLERMEAE